ncbi:hypothetical protein [Bosea sp. F3-2]|uniref:hypothetical protein n=1 Tax=Bosea sp. F3-2 TaxID=2599640 RepID=UPI0016564F0B|nr:hypothetical protein [Bosea sp. F3-2]
MTYFLKVFGHRLILGDQPFRHIQIAGLYAEWSIVDTRIYNYCDHSFVKLGDRA